MKTSLNRNQQLFVTFLVSAFALGASACNKGSTYAEALQIEEFEKKRLRELIDNRDKITASLFRKLSSEQAKLHREELEALEREKTLVTMRFGQRGVIDDELQKQLDSLQSQIQQVYKDGPNATLENPELAKLLKDNVPIRRLKDSAARQAIELTENAKTEIKQGLHIELGNIEVEIKTRYAIKHQEVEAYHQEAINRATLEISEQIAAQEKRLLYAEESVKQLQPI